MTDVSPLSDKVDTFLSSLSQLSQAKLREDQERQQRLQRNIDELHLRLNSTSPIKSSLNSSNVSLGKSHYGYKVPDLKFNRSKITEKEIPGNGQSDDPDDDAGPELPKRPAKYDTDDKTPPPLPRRKYKEQQRQQEEKEKEEAEEEENPPALPRRKNNTEEINLLNPVPRKSSFPLPNQTPSKSPKPTATKPDFKVETRPTVGQHRSFRDIESMIKSGDTKQNSVSYAPVSASAAPHPPRPRPRPQPRPKKLQEPVKSQQPEIPSTPVKPIKSNWLTSLATAKTTTITPQSPESKNGGNKSPVLKPRNNNNNGDEKYDDEEAEFILKFKELKPAKKKPVVPPSPKPAAQPIPGVPALKKPIAKPLKPVSLTEGNDVKVTRLFETKEEAEFKSKFEKLKTGPGPGPGPVPPRKPKKLASFSETPSEFQNKFNKIAAKSPQKLQRPATTGSLGNYKEKDTSELRSQLERLVSARTKAGPSVSSTSTSTSLLPLPLSLPSRSSTKRDTVIKELVPKKSDTQAGDDKLVHPTKARTKGPKRRLPKTMLKGGSNAGKSVESETPPVELLPELKNTKKVGPPVNKHTKPKEVGQLKPSRDVSGDFFV